MDTEEPDALDLEEIEPDAYDHLEMAYELEKDDQYEDALTECDAAIEKALALVADAYNMRGILLEELDRTDEAMQAYQKALEIEPSFKEAADNLNDLESDMGISHEPVAIATYANSTEAHLARAQLEVEGLWSYVTDESALPGVPGAVRLLVRESDAMQAMDILGIELPEEEEEDEDDEDEFDEDDLDMVIVDVDDDEDDFDDDDEDSILFVVGEDEDDEDEDEDDLA